jgi:hypothetical protein
MIFTLKAAQRLAYKNDFCKKKSTDFFYGENVLILMGIPHNKILKLFAVFC